MPDILVHVAAARLVSAPMRNPTLLLLVLIGTVLPDLASKFMGTIVGSGLAMVTSHTIVGIILLSYAASLLLHEPLRPAGFLALLGGGALHVGMDLLKTSLTGTPLLVPFSDQSFALGLFDSVDSLYAAPVALLTLGFFWWRSRAK